MYKVDSDDIEASAVVADCGSSGSREKVEQQGPSHAATVGSRSSARRMNMRKLSADEESVAPMG